MLLKQLLNIVLPMKPNEKNVNYLGMFQNSYFTTTTCSVLNSNLCWELSNISLIFCIHLFFFSFSSLRNDASFTQTHVQRVRSSPTQDGDNSTIEFYVTYPDGSTMSEEVLILIMSAKIASIGTNTKMDLELVTPEIPTPRPPTVSENENAVSVVLVNFQANEVSKSRN